MKTKFDTRILVQNVLRNRPPAGPFGYYARTENVPWAHITFDRPLGKKARKSLLAFLDAIGKSHVLN